MSGRRHFWCLVVLRPRLNADIIAAWLLVSYLYVNIALAWQSVTEEVNSHGTGPN